MSTAFQRAANLGGFDREALFGDAPWIASLLTYGQEHHDDGESDSYANPFTEVIRRLDGKIHPAAMRKLRAELEPLAGRYASGTWGAA